MKARYFYTPILASCLGLGTAAADLTTDLVVYYQFDDLSNAAQASGPDATEVGTGSYTGSPGGLIGSAAEFTGTTGDLIQAPIGFGGGGGDELGNSFTISALYQQDTDA
ncbi:MAG: hypothetical protein ACO3RV_09475, partial [Luteolibacter sp.]